MDLSTHDLLKRILVMSVLGWGLLITALTDHPHAAPATTQARSQTP
jgi:hypothetical protein